MSLSSSSAGVVQQGDAGGGGVEGNSDTDTLRQTMDYIKDVCEL